ncbi:acetyl esterase/lipase [Actinoplanes lutulentus]|uniref:Acetyl esterase/lipase n=1 Tax=Actinoplanes lutulentus TaxID=1287878 RepID=A0A327ZG69_9ACTN|nr:alpha/beta hydrolase fold domain-containing protein [Actinoplanes lutulentus]MBB2947249.1 acetyl esterase/lipase [Actinoplanes lutulentus]RAK36524.1 acetyl esterase/lipase [Actinoplanes lutulentus]
MSLTIENRRIDGPHGSIPVRVYTPDRQADAEAGLVWAHGGAFFGGDLDMPESDGVARQFAGRGITVVTVDYRLAPVLDWATGTAGESAGRVRYPVASEEVTAAFRWAADAFPVARGWAIGGASAGGNLTAGATLRLRDHGGPLPRAVLLVYPVLHAGLPPMPAELAAKVATLPNADLIGAEAISRMNLNYVREPAALQEPYAFPGGHDLTGLPPTFILNSDIDPLRASGQRYGAELAAAGVDLVMIRESGTRHGHLNEPDNPAAVRSVSRMADWLLSLPENS